MIRTMCVAIVLVTISLAGCSNETPQHDFAFDLGGDDATPLLPSVVPAFDEAILAQRTVASGSSASGGRGAPAPTPPPAPVDAPAPITDSASPTGGPSRPTLGGQLGDTGTGPPPYQDQAVARGPAKANSEWGFPDGSGKMVYPPQPNPAEPVNYIQWINETFAVDDAENAANDYLAAYDQIEKFEGGKEDQAAQINAMTGPWSGNKKVSDWLAANRAGLAKFRAAAAKPECFFVRSTVSGDLVGQPWRDEPRWKDFLINVHPPSLSGHRTAAMALIAEGWRAWDAGNRDRLPGNALVVLRSAHHLYRQTTLIERLMTVALSMLAHDALRNALRLAPDPESLATWLAPQLAAADPAPRDFTKATAAQRLLAWDRCQRLFMPGRQAGTWVIHEPMFNRLVQSIYDSAEKAKALAAAQQELRRIGFDQTFQEINAYWDAFDQWSRAPYHEAPDGGGELERSILESKNPLVKAFTHSLSFRRARLIDERMTATRRATHLIVHLFAHRAKTGTFPPSLGGLDGPNLDQLRIDPFSGRDFVYRRVGQSFTLYSLAENLEDDRGRHDPKWANADHVFWPVQDR